MKSHGESKGSLQAANSASRGQMCPEVVCTWGRGLCKSTVTRASKGSLHSAISASIGQVVP